MDISEKKYGRIFNSACYSFYKSEFITDLSSPKLFQGKNLTGTARLVRDLAADIHANIQQWNNLQLQGVAYLKDITQEKRDKNYSETLQDLCEKLENVCDNLVNVFFKHSFTALYFDSFISQYHFGIILLKIIYIYFFFNLNN